MLQQLFNHAQYHYFFKVLEEEINDGENYIFVQRGTDERKEHKNLYHNQIYRKSEKSAFFFGLGGRTQLYVVAFLVG